MRIEALLEKYFEGATSCEEERLLRHLFAEGEVPEELQAYRPLFAYIDNEQEKRRHAAKPVESPRKHRPLLRRMGYALGGMAAGIALAVGMTRFIATMGAPESYVLINGVRYTDEKLVEAKALEALQNASFTEQELNSLLFPPQ